MFVRCSRAPPKSFYYNYNPAFRLVRLRFSSSVPERRRKLRDGPTSPLRRFVYKWLLSPYLLFGIVSGFALSKYFKRNANDSFATYTLASKEPVSSTASIFHLEPAQQSQNYELYKEAWRRGIWNVQFKQPQLQIVRAYTPLPPLDAKSGKEKDELRFLIRHDPHGEVSSYLHRLPTKSEVEVRGPFLEYESTPDVRQVVFFAGGTGIAPALQVAHALFEGTPSTESGVERKDRKLHILWANRSREDCLGGISDEPPTDSPPQRSTWSGIFSTPKPKRTTPPITTQKGPIVRELESLKSRYSGRVTVEYFVNAEDTWIDEAAVFGALSRFDDLDSSSSPSRSGGERQILISGPPGFIAHLAGPKEWRNGREEQGAVSRIVAHALARTPHCVKVWKI